MMDGFYRSFEEKYRGPYELIKNRLSVYSVLLQFITRIYQNPEALDLGCGRGEWLDILKEQGISGKGVDIDEEMMAGARKRGLEAIHADAAEYLKSLPDQSLALISAFHLVEHLPFSQLQMLVEQSLRVLKPGGILIMETPNPDNIAVGTSRFYLDPTHHRPIPSKLLSFVPEFYGYGRVKIIHLQEAKEVAGLQNITLMNVISDVSPDYAVVAQKSGDKDIIEKADAFFKQDQGVTLETMLVKYDQQTQKNLVMEEMIIQQAKDCMAHAEARAVNAEKLAARIQVEAEQANRRADLADQTTDQLQARLNAVYASRSWRMTRPLRNAKSLLFSLARLPMKILRAMLVFFIRQVLVRPALSRAANAFLIRFPRLRQRLQKIAAGSGLITPVHGSGTSMSNLFREPFQSPDPADMTPTARRIYGDLKKAMEQSRKGKN